MMARLKFPAIIVCLLLVLGMAAGLFRTAAAQGIPDPGPVVLIDEQGKYPLGLHLEILEDPDGTLTIEDVSSPDYNDRFLPSQVKVPSYGYTDSAYWVRLPIDNRTSQAADWLLEVGFANMFYVDLYTPLPGGEGFIEKKSGVLRHPSTRDVLDPRILFRLSIPSQSQQTIYMRFQNGASMTLPLTLWKESVFLDNSIPRQWLVGLFYGALIGLLFYNIFLLFSLREANYLYLVLFLASFLAWNASYDGYTEVFFIPDLYALKPYYFPLFHASFFVFILLFGDMFLEFRSRLPRFRRITIIVLGVWGILLLTIPFFPYNVYARLMVIWGLPSVLSPIIAAILLWRQRYTAARFFMIAWFGMLIAFMITLFARLGLLPSSFFTENIFRLGVVWMAVGWSMALADRINLLKAETDQANRNLQQSEHRLSQILDGMPLGVVLYTNDHRPKYANQRSIELLSNPDQGIRPDISVGRTEAQAIEYFSLKVAGRGDVYPLENFPVYSALKGSSSYIDDVEMDKCGQRVPLEMWASPIKDDMGKVDAAVLVFQDITGRREAEAELAQYRQMLESLVEQRTAEVNAANKELRLRLEWLAAVNLVNQMIARSANFSEIQERIVEIIKHLFASQDSFIAEVDFETRQMNILAHSGIKEYPELDGLSVLLPERMPTHVELEPGKPIMMSKHELAFLAGPMSMHVQGTGVESIAFFPLQVREKVLGYLGLELREQERMITSEEANLLNIFSTDIAQLIEDARLFEQAKLLVAAEERNRLARELHDSVAQALYSISLFTNATRLALEANKTGVVKQHLEELTQLSHEAMSDMRLLIFELRPPILEKSGLAAALQSRLESVETRAGFEAHFESKGDFRLSPDQEGELYRIAQEALNNVLKHAHASKVSIQLIGQGGYARLTIEDDGIGFDPLTIEQGGGQGFRNMRERAANIGARCSFDSVPDRGTKITIEVNE